MERDKRLQTSREWREVRRRGKCLGSKLCVICVLPGGTGEHFGFSTARGFRTAVSRNRARRRLREAFLQVYKPDGQPRAVTAVAFLPALDVDFDRLKSSVARQLRDLGVSTQEV